MKTQKTRDPCVRYDVILHSPLGGDYTYHCYSKNDAERHADDLRKEFTECEVEIRNA
jgi:hypothetical protein